MEKNGVLRYLLHLFISCEKERKSKAIALLVVILIVGLSNEWSEKEVNERMNE